MTEVKLFKQSLDEFIRNAEKGVTAKDREGNMIDHSKLELLGEIHRTYSPSMLGMHPLVEEAKEVGANYVFGVRYVGYSNNLLAFGDAYRKRRDTDDQDDSGE